MSWKRLKFWKKKQEVGAEPTETKAEPPEPAGTKVDVPKRKRRAS